MVDAEKQERIRAIARELGYVPNASAVNLRRQRTATIGLVTDAIASAPFAGPLLSGASDVALEAGYMILTIDTWQHPSYVDGAMTTLRARDVDGLIYADAGLRQVDRLDAPRRSASGHGQCLRRGQLATGVHLRRRGRRAVRRRAGARGRPPPDRLHHRQLGLARHAGTNPGIRCGAEGRRTPPVEDSIISARYNVSSNHAAALEFLRCPDRPTAILAANDRGATGVVLAAASLGLTVPQDLSVVGYDDEQFLAAEVPPGLTTIALPHREMGQRAAAELLARIAGEDHGEGGTERLPCLPVVRGTVASPPQL